MFLKRSIIILLVLVLALSIIGCGGNGNGGTATGTSQDGVVTLRINAAWAEGNSMLYGMEEFIEKVSEKTNGTVKVEWGGGPESIPSYQLIEALRNGVIDIAWTAHTYNASHVPVMEAMKLTDADVLRKTGGYEFVYDLYKKEINAHYIAATTNGLTYNLYTKNEINKLDDFRGLTIRATPAYQSFVEALGAGVVNTPPGEAYQALERNVIQGYGWPSVGVIDFGWQEVSKYIIQPPFYNVDVCIMLSDKAWTRLDESQQQAILEAGRELEAASKEYYAKAIEEENNKLMEEGMVELELPDDVAEEFYNLAYEKGWESAEKVDPENAKKLKEFSE